MFRKLQVSSGIKAGLSGAQEASERDESHKRVGAEGSGLTGHLVWRRKMVGTAQPSLDASVKAVASALPWFPQCPCPCNWEGTWSPHPGKEDLDNNRCCGRL